MTKQLRMLLFAIFVLAGMAVPMTGILAQGPSPATGAAAKAEAQRKADEAAKAEAQRKADEAAKAEPQRKAGEAAKAEPQRKADDIAFPLKLFGHPLFRAYGAPVLVIVVTIFFQFTGHKPVHEWFYLGPVLAWTSFVLAVEKVSDLASEANKIQPGSDHQLMVPEHYVNSLFYALMFFIFWFCLYSFIQAYHIRYDCSEKDILDAKNKEPNDAKKAARERTMKWQRNGFICGAGNVLGVLTVLLFQSTLMRS